jgi:acyl-CoA synthetase (NDP forming)
MTSEEHLNLNRMFKPRGVALFGGVNTPGSFGHLIMMSQMRYGYSGRLYPISPKGGAVGNHKIYTSLDEVDGPVDLASISLPAKFVPDVVRQCLDHGLAGVQIQASGFAETGEPENMALQQELVDIAGRGIRVVGPNCFGIHCPAGGITLLPGSDFSKLPGGTALISQSGGVATDFGHEARRTGLGISKLVSYGNGCDLDAVSLLEYFCDDPETERIGAYLEGVSDGRRFLKILKRTTAKKPVVIWKAGLSPLGGRAAQSHTGSLAGGEAVWKGALRQAGAVLVEGLDELVDALCAFKYLKTGGRRLAMIGGGGAIGVFTSDLAYRFGLEMPTFSPEAQEKLRPYFPTPGNSMANPLDTGSPIIPAETMAALFDILLDEPVDVLVIMLLLRPLIIEIRTFMGMMGMEAPPPDQHLEAMLDALTALKKKTDKDIVIVFENRAHMANELEVEEIARIWRPKYQEAGIPVYPSADRALNAVRCQMR